MSQMAVAETQKQVRTPTDSARGRLQRKCDKCREKELILQRSPIGSAPVSVSPKARKSLRSPEAQDANTPASMKTQFGQDFSQIPVHHELFAGVQAKLTVNAPGDVFEQEADRVAEEVMSMPPAAQSGMKRNQAVVYKVGAAAGLIQREPKSPDKQGDCSGWEKDCESFCRRAAKQYWIDIGVSPPPVAPGPVECENPFHMCHLKYKNGVTVSVGRSISGGRNIEVWQTRPDDKTKLNIYSGPVCDYRYFCTKKQNDLVLEKKFCYDPRTEKRPKETEQESSPPSTIQRSSTHESSIPQAPPVVQDVLNSTGVALDPATSAFMEDRFGHDFSSVRVHTDARAAQSARLINARAYTAGSHIVFGAGQLDSARSQSRKLLAHELAHVVQQRSGNVSRQLIQRSLISYRQLKWTDFMANPPGVKNPREGAEINTRFDLMPTYSPVTNVKRTKISCGKGRNQSTKVEATSAPDPADFAKPEAQMDQDKSWARDRYKGNGTNFCTDVATRCENDFDNAPAQVRSTCQQAASDCRNAFKRGQKSFGQYFDNSPVMVTKEADCMTTFLSKCQQLLIKGFSVTDRGATARTKADCRGDFSKQCLVSEVAERARLLRHEQGHFDITNVI